MIHSWSRSFDVAGRPPPYGRRVSAARYLSALAVGGWLLAGIGAGCNSVLEKPGLEARIAGPVESPDCRSCHGYPLRDANHAYHLEHVAPNKFMNGPVTCMDCHFGSLQHARIQVLDSVFRRALDSTGTRFDFWSSQDFPDNPELRLLPLERVDTLWQDLPFPAPERPGDSTAFREYLTGLAHMNGRVDVEFAPNLSYPEDFEGQQAAYFPESQTCSAVACHPTNKTPYWRFASKTRGFTELRGREGDVP